MIKKLKKGFTLVELIVVIAIIAILSTVAVVGYTRVVDKANVSNDTQLVRNLNERLQLAEAETGYSTPETAHEAFVLTEDFGFIIEKLTPTSSGNDIVWDMTTNRFALIDSITHESIYTDPTVELSDNPGDLWKVYKTVEAAANSKYSVYLAGTNLAGIVDAKVGVDVGRNTEITEINYVNSGAKQDVVIRTNGGDLTVDATNDDVKHYGLVNGLTVAAVRVYHEFGFVGNLKSFETGKFVAENGAQFHQTRDEIDLILNGKSSDLDNGEEYTQHYYVGGQCIVCNKDEQDQNVELINYSGTLTMSMGESVNIKFNWGSAVFWSLNSQSQGADNQYHEIISNESIYISNINVEQNTATVRALKAGTNNVKVTSINEETGVSSSVQFKIVVIATALTATIDPSKYNNQTLDTPANLVSHLVFGEYSKYVDVWEGEPYCIMDQAGKGTIRAYSVTNSSNGEIVLYILSQSAMIYPQQKISSITAKFKNIKTIDLGNLDFSYATGADDFNNMFYDGWSGLTELTTIFATAEQVAQMHKFDLSDTKMFQECTSLVGGKDTVWSVYGNISGSHNGTKGYYAYIDGQGLEETGNKGYFTDRTKSPYGAE